MPRGRVRRGGTEGKGDGMEGRSPVATPPGSWVVDGALVAVLLASAWRGARRGGLATLAGLAAMVASAAWLAGRADDVIAWAAARGLVTGLARLVEPWLAAWLPADLLRAPVQPATLLRVLDLLARGAGAPSVEDGWGRLVREAARTIPPGATVGELLATALAGAVIADLCLYAVPLALGLVLGAVARRIVASLPALRRTPWERWLGLLLGGCEGAIVAGGVLVLVHQLRGHVPTPFGASGWDALEQARLATWLVAGWQALWSRLTAAAGSSWEGAG